MEALASVEVEDAIAGRFWSKVEKTETCWLWLGVLRTGYGRFKIHGRYYSAHILAYEWSLGSIPEGLTLDHTCHGDDPLCLGGRACYHRRCVNPSHLEPVTMAENLARGLSPSARPDLYPRIVCSKGHELSGLNVYTRPDGRRECRRCRRAAKGG